MTPDDFFGKGRILCLICSHLYIWCVFLFVPNLSLHNMSRVCKYSYFFQIGRFGGSKNEYRTKSLLLTLMENIKTYFSWHGLSSTVPQNNRFRKGIKKQSMLLLNLSMKYCEHTIFHIVTIGRWLSWEPSTHFSDSCHLVFNPSYSFQYSSKFWYQITLLILRGKLKNILGKLK